MSIKKPTSIMLALIIDILIFYLGLTFSLIRADLPVRPRK